MGHAHIGNLSKFFRDRLYARGTLSIKEACVQAAAAGEELQASEGGYDSPAAAALGIGFHEIVGFLSLAGDRRRRFPGVDSEWPWIVPDLSVWGPGRGRGRPSRVSARARRMLEELELTPDLAHFSTAADDIAAKFQVAADLIGDEGFPEWEAWLRLLPRLRRASWLDANDANYDWSSDEMPYDEDGNLWYAIDLIPWKYAPGKRRQYRDCPLMGSITN